MIEKIDIDLFKNAQESDYNKAKAEYIANYETWVDSTIEWHGFLLSTYTTGKKGHYKKDPETGLVEWNKKYPNGYQDWSVKKFYLNAGGEQKVIDKINEIAEALNKLEK